MNNTDSKDTRYYIDIDPGKSIVLNYGLASRHILSKQIQKESVVRIYITKGQYNKILQSKK